MTAGQGQFVRRKQEKDVVFTRTVLPYLQQNNFIIIFIIIVVILKNDDYAFDLFFTFNLFCDLNISLIFLCRSTLFILTHSIVFDLI